MGDAETAVYEETFGGDNPPPIASCTDGGACAAATPYGISAFPTFILIAPDGEIVNQDIWPLSNGAATFTALFESFGIQQMACATGVEAVEKQVELRVFPNPASEVLRLEGEPGSRWSVLDAMGREVMQGTTRSDVEAVDVSGWAEGVYFVQWTWGAGIRTERVVVGR